MSQATTCDVKSLFDLIPALAEAIVLQEAVISSVEVSTC